MKVAPPVLSSTEIQLNKREIQHINKPRVLGFIFFEAFPHRTPLLGIHMDLKAKLAVIRQIKSIYDDFANTLSVACENKCAACCTRNVILTSLEGYEIIQYLESNHQYALLDKLRKDADKKRFQPEVTTNGLAELCMRGEDPPDEESDAAWGQCPLLIDDLCSIYESRPFECRSFISENDCRQAGSADMDPYVITVNNVLRQFIEHVDQPGISGNLTDMLLFLSSEGQLESYQKNELNANESLLANLPLQMLLIPPEYQTKVQPIIKSIQDIRIDLGG